jgi:hypothetical protein
MKKTLAFLLIAFITTIFSCKKDNKCYDPTNPDCENYDPCHNAKMHSADFIIEHNIPDENDDWFWFKGDSVFSGGLLQFRSLEKGILSILGMLELKFYMILLLSEVSTLLHLQNLLIFNMLSNINLIVCVFLRMMVMIRFYVYFTWF